MAGIGVFSERGWDAVYRIRSAVNTGDADDFGALSVGVDPEVAVQTTMIGETLLRAALGDDPPAATLAGAAATLTPHLRHLLRAPALDAGHAADLIRTGLRLRDCPGWASRAQTMMFFCGFLAPVDDADFLDFRLRAEPAWAGAIEDHVR
ncbi:hypothetical protein ACPXB3_20685 [Gordonia sp. DT219]|uniref:hypothetical protein n=1 Tax=Gordonia sp. DT219 TaxID=3416658 RepID=UPI003CE997D3